MDTETHTTEPFSVTFPGTIAGSLIRSGAGGSDTGTIWDNGTAGRGFTIYAATLPILPLLALRTTHPS